MQKLLVRTSENREIIDITDQVQDALTQADASVAHVTVLHTTAAVTCADLDPGTDQDFLDFLEAITPKVQWRHPHDPSHAPDHLLASLIGPSVTVPVKSGKPVLGTWQRIILVELDGPRERTVVVSGV